MSDPYLNPTTPACFARSVDALRTSVGQFMGAVGDLGVLDVFKDLLDEISILDTYGVSASRAWVKLRELPRWRWLARWCWVRWLLSCMSSVAEPT